VTIVAPGGMLVVGTMPVVTVAAVVVV